MNAIFPAGSITATPGVLNAIPQAVIVASLGRHVRGDWGDVSPEDAKENDLSVKEGFRILSVYHHEGVKFWIITEATRESTTLLLPEEY